MGLLEKILVGVTKDLGNELTSSTPLEKKSGIQQESVTRGAPLPSASKGSSQIIQVSQLPLSLRLSDYQNAYSNANPEGDLIAAQKFQQLVDLVPELNHNFMTSQSSIERVYGQIVNGASYQINNSFLASMLSKARYNFETSSQPEFAGHGDWRLVEAIPNDWYNADKSRFKKIRIPLESDGNETKGLDFLGSNSSPTTLTLGEEEVLLSEGTHFTHCELEYMLVRFVRPWMDFTLFETDGWWISGQQPGYCSSGSTDENSGILPLITTGMILVRSAQFEGNLDQEDKKRIRESLETNKDVYVGPYRLTNNADSVPTVNVAAWICELVPLSPKNEKPDSGSVKINNKGAFAARFSVSWKVAGVETIKKSGIFPVLANREIEIPFDVTNITIKIDIMTFPKPAETWSNVKTVQLKNPKVIEYELSGVTWKPDLKEI